ncbi:uncharacterized protein LOC120429085 isoform X2 [Culex pipiens pallens]|uniref:uncharacterized protein LOC120419265 isoform X2 n=1 Tax=Culex pipiens pallens TaxID=42434 RepID=UPI0019533A7A|nr:uncharacterized protein LOC120419265 isoform X2 [Culex pipiens pallens]XP_052567320.1 uncharacterized protein LOC120429085 isoform X2 [Culex pipiens pallens]
MSSYQHEFLKKIQNGANSPTPSTSKRPTKNNKPNTKSSETYPINVQKILHLNETGSTSSQHTVAPISLEQHSENEATITPKKTKLHQQSQTYEMSAKLRKIEETGISPSLSTDTVTTAMGQIAIENSAALSPPEIFGKTPETHSEPTFMQLILQKLDNIEQSAVRKEQIDRELLDVSIKTKNKVSRLEKDMVTIKKELADIKRNRGQRNENLLPITSEEYLNQIEENFAEYEEDLRKLFESIPSVSAYGLYRHFCDPLLDHLPKYNMTGKKAPNTTKPEIEPKGAEHLNIFKLLLSVGINRHGLDLDAGRKDMIKAFKTYYDAVDMRLKKLNAKK